MPTQKFMAKTDVIAKPEIRDNRQDRAESTELGNSVPNVKHSPNNDTDENKKLRRRKLTVYERISFDLTNDQKCIKEVTLGKRIGFYKFRGDLGSGNFSQVKIAVHVLTKGGFCLLTIYIERH